MKKRGRSTSLDAQIKREAKKIYDTGMAAAMNAAIGKLVCEKLDEIRTILAATGYSVGMVPPASPILAPPAPPAPPKVENPCVHCGRAGVKRAKPNRWNRGNPPWYCRDHIVLAAEVQAEDNLDNMVLGAQPPLPNPEPALPPAPPVQMLKQVEAPEPQGVSMAEALGMAALED